jgi:hypothetical protein
MPAQQPAASPTGSATSAAPSSVIPGSSSTAPPARTEFTIPDCSDPRAITNYALQRLNVIIAAYQPSQAASGSMTIPQPRLWPEELDALVAASVLHRGL